MNKKFDYQKIFQINYKDFIDSLFKCKYSFKHLNILYNFLVFKIIQKKMKLYSIVMKHLSNSELGKIFGKLFELIFRE